MKFTQCLSTQVVACVFLAGSGLAPVHAEKNSVEEQSCFGGLRSPPLEEVRLQAEAWLKRTGKGDERMRKAFQAVWTSDKPILDKVAETFILADSTAAKLAAEWRDPLAVAPMELPAVFKSSELPVFYRANLGLVYARSLSNQRVYEESLAVLRSIKPEQVVDPAAYLFYRGVAEHALMQKQEAGKSLLRLLEDAPDSPARYRVLASLMLADMEKWQEKDLGWIARKMQNSKRRLELTRGGRQTQKIQKDALVQLDMLIKEMEKKSGQSQGQIPCQCQKPSQCQKPGGQCNMPQKDSYGGNVSGSGYADPKKFRETTEVWGKLPEKERAKAMLELTRDMPPRYREVIDNYFKELAKKSDSTK